MEFSFVQSTFGRVTLDFHLCQTALRSEFFHNLSTQRQNRSFCFLCCLYRNFHSKLTKLSRFSRSLRRRIPTPPNSSSSSNSRCRPASRCKLVSEQLFVSLCVTLFTEMICVRGSAISAASGPQNLHELILRYVPIVSRCKSLVRDVRVPVSLSMIHVKEAFFSPALRLFRACPMGAYDPQK